MTTPNPGSRKKRRDSTQAKNRNKHLQEKWAPVMKEYAAEEKVRKAKLKARKSKKRDTSVLKIFE